MSPRRAAYAVIASAFAHAAGAVTAGAIIEHATRPAIEHQAPVEVDVASVATIAEEAPAAAPSAPAPPETRRLPQRRPAASRRMVTPSPASRSNEEVREAAPVPVADHAQIPARFALSAGTVATRPSSSALPSAQRSTGGGDPRGSQDSDAVAEREVSVPARLLASSPLVYPARARQAEIEVDLPLEIVVDTTGRVGAARVLGAVGYGLEEAAMEAIRAYRFSPALRDGQPVRVRMRWTMQFRLH